MRPTIQQNEVVVCDGLRPMGAIVPRGGKYEAHLADGTNLGAFATVVEARRAILDADKAVKHG